MRHYRWIGLTALVAALGGFVLAAVAAFADPTRAAASGGFWAGVALIATGFLTQATLLFRLIRRRGLRGIELRLVLTRAVWGGPFGTLGAIWDLTAGPDARPGP